MMSSAVLWLLRLAGPERRGAALGHIGLANSAGLTVGPLLAGALGVRTATILPAAAVLPLAATALSRLAAVPAAAPSRAGGAAPARAVLGPGVALLCVNVGYVALLGFGPAVTGTALIVPLFAAGVIAVRTLGGQLPARLGARRTATCSALVAAGGLALVACAVGVPGTLVLALGPGLAVPARRRLAPAPGPPPPPGAAAGLFFAFFDAGVGAGGPLTGAMARLTTPAGALWLAAGAVALAAVITQVRLES
jgi:hypothetical protein